uniref:DUF4005 domain-containing protein n=1 Tax=Macrostomum lignano TaxID=282301 RepID=A0A1I8JN71_9PLAT
FCVIQQHTCRPSQSSRRHCVATSNADAGSGLVWKVEQQRGAPGRRRGSTRPICDVSAQSAKSLRKYSSAWSTSRFSSDRTADNWQKSASSGFASSRDFSAATRADRRPDGKFLLPNNPIELHKRAASFLHLRARVVSAAICESRSCRLGRWQRANDDQRNLPPRCTPDVEVAAPSPSRSSTGRKDRRHSAAADSMLPSTPSGFSDSFFELSDSNESSSAMFSIRSASSRLERQLKATLPPPPPALPPRVSVDCFCAGALWLDCSLLINHSIDFLSRILLISLMLISPRTRTHEITEDRQCAGHGNYYGSTANSTGVRFTKAVNSFC